MDCPYFNSSLQGLEAFAVSRTPVGCIAILHGFDFVEPATMAFFVRESCVNECVHQFFRQGIRYYPGTEHENVCIVVFHALVRRVGVVTKTGPYSNHLIGGNRGAYSAAANQHSTLRLTVENGGS